MPHPIPPPASSSLPAAVPATPAPPAQLPAAPSPPGAPRAPGAQPNRPSWGRRVANQMGRTLREMGDSVNELSQTYIDHAMAPLQPRIDAAAALTQRPQEDALEGPAPRPQEAAVDGLEPQLQPQNADALSRKKKKLEKKLKDFFTPLSRHGINMMAAMDQRLAQLGDIEHKNEAELLESKLLLSQQQQLAEFLISMDQTLAKINKLAWQAVVSAIG